MIRKMTPLLLNSMAKVKKTLKPNFSTKPFPKETNHRRMAHRKIALRMLLFEC
jgi:hypothetical protein